MKKAFLAVLLCLSLIIAGCGIEDDIADSAAENATGNTTNSTASTTDATQEEQTEILMYPSNTGIDFVEYALFPPKEIYTTTAEENGHAGEIYTVSGRVEDYFISDDGMGYLRISTLEGEVIISDAAESFRTAAGLEALGQIDFDKLRSYCPIPEEGEYCVVFAEYQGMSNTFGCPFFVYASSDYLSEALLRSIAVPAVNDKPDETQPSQAANATPEEKQALADAKDYLSFSAFSYSGLIDQLEYEGYSKAESTYAADNCGADWYEQALKSAKQYLSFSAFSYEGLTEQLEYEGFSKSESTYAADNCGADWYEQAEKLAEQYMGYRTFTRSDLIEQLEYEGFTHDQAVHGVDSVGL